MTDAEILELYFPNGPVKRFDDQELCLQCFNLFKGDEAFKIDHGRRHWDAGDRREMIDSPDDEVDYDGYEYA